MCNNCNCENYEKCSIVGYMPVGFCCTRCLLYDEKCTCLTMHPLKSKEKADLEIASNVITLVSTKIEGGMLKVVLEQEGKRIPIVIDFNKQFE